MKKNITAIITGVVLVVLWQLAAILINIPHILPGPYEIVKQLWEDRTVLFTVHLPFTLLSIVVGFLISVVIGVGLAVLMDSSETVEHMLYPSLVVIQTIPVMCIAPLFVLWFGYTLTARLTAIVLSTFFSITVNTFDGFKRTKAEMSELMKTYGAGKQKIFWHIKVPTALPNLVTAMKITFPWAVIGAAISEWLGATQGLGYFSKLMISKLNGASVFASVFLLSLIAVIGMGIVKILDRRFVVWRNEV